MNELKNYYIYLIRCQDNSLYTGITTDIERRYKEHLEGRGAKYTKARGVSKLEIFFSCRGRADASKIEYYLKRLSKSNKERVILDYQWFITKVESDIDVKIKKQDFFKKIIDRK